MTTRDLPRATVGRLDAMEDQLKEITAALRGAGVLPHGAKGTLITTADCTDFATAKVLGNVIKAAWNAHCADVDAHIVADSTNTTAAADATTDASLYTLLNEMQGDMNGHVPGATYHGEIGGALGIAVGVDDATTAASDEATSVALANALKACFNRHVAAGAHDLASVSG